MKARAPGFPPTRILVPLDPSEASIAAWDYAKKLAKAFDADVEGLYVQEWLHSALGLGEGDPLTTANASRQALSRLRARLGEEIPVVSETGPVEDTILSWGRELGYDLIVMGTHGRKGLEHTLKGSVAETVVRYSEIPVLVVHAEAAKPRAAALSLSPGSRPAKSRRRRAPLRS